jgi:hypothetical protein
MIKKKDGLFPVTFIELLYLFFLLCSCEDLIRDCNCNDPECHAYPEADFRENYEPARGLFRIKIPSWFMLSKGEKKKNNFTGPTKEYFENKPE